MNILKSLAALAILIAALCDPVSAQTNDNFANRRVIASAGGTVSGSNVGATKETGEPDHASPEWGKSVWWTWTPATSGKAEISTAGSNFDTLLGVYTGTSVGALTERASNDDSGDLDTSFVSFYATAGTAYQIAVAGSYGRSSSISLTVTPTVVVATNPLPAEGGTADGGGAYTSRTSATVTAMAAPGYVFVNWTENGAPVSNAASYTFTLSANRTLVANFTVELGGPNTYGIKKLDVGRGELTFTEVSGAVSYRVEWSATMAPGSWSRQAPGVPSIQPIGPGDRTVIIGIIPPPCFYRVVAEIGPRVPQGFVRIPAGGFQMGDTFEEGPWAELPVHAVNVSAFFLQERETTKAEWDVVRTWALAHGYNFDNPGSGKGGNHPVYFISWYDVVKWCNARSEKEGLVPCYYTDAARTQVYKTGQVNVTNDQVLWTANGYRLPTEAEWEKAARGGLQGKRFPWGDTITHSLANYYSRDSYAYDTSPTRWFHPLYDSADSADWPYTSPVGSFAPNGYGLYDMAGNVREWCWDWHDINNYTVAETTDPRGSSRGTSRAIRGGSWFHSADSSRVADREGVSPSIDRRLDFLLGFRPARGR
jgi:sulfatase modifying factor 1